MSALRFAVIGCGVIGEKHAKSIAAVGELVLVVDEIPDRATKLAGAYDVAFTTSVSDALSRKDIDAIAVCTPSGTHADIAIAALRAGKHVVVEKPVDVTLEAADRLLRAERESGRTVTVISQHRFDTASRLVRRAVEDGDFGRITSGVASVAWWRSQEYYDSGGWRGTLALDGGGALMNQGIHTVDLLVWMLGEPVEVFAWTACLAHERIEVEDVATATIRFAGGALGAVHGTTAAYPGLTARVQIHGDRGSAVIDDDRLVTFHSAERDAPPLDSGPRAGAGSDPTALSEAHTEQYRDFADAIEQGRPPLVTVADARRTLAVILAIYESARTDVPVRLR
ncbi:Gfo/Idh/MocA family protein [Amycolatopsis sp. NPDC059027]|uniref:Gfo/Idh/MocA family protein n=1 Tax=unclassified Amycolatopsis TaxID=2618356 RepID=UPI00366C8F14